MVSSYGGFDSKKKHFILNRLLNTRMTWTKSRLEIRQVGLRRGTPFCTPEHSYMNYSVTKTHLRINRNCDNLPSNRHACHDHLPGLAHCSIQKFHLDNTRFRSPLDLPFNGLWLRILYASMACMDPLILPSVGEQEFGCYNLIIIVFDRLDAGEFNTDEVICAEPCMQCMQCVVCVVARGERELTRNKARMLSRI
jgi:hypothetical protein